MYEGSAMRRGSGSVSPVVRKRSSGEIPIILGDERKYSNLPASVGLRCFGAISPA
jgi:hypothetical protein